MEREKIILLTGILVLIVGFGATTSISNNGIVTPELDSTGDEVNVTSDLNLQSLYTIKGLAVTQNLGQMSSNDVLTRGDADSLYMVRNSPQLNGSFDVNGYKMRNVKNISSDGTGITLEDKLDMGNNIITNLPDPSTTSSEVATQTYVDSQVGSLDAPVDQRGVEGNIDMQGYNITTSNSETICIGNEC